MKNLTVLLFAILMSTTTYSFNEDPTKKEIRTKIVNLLGVPNFAVKKDVKTLVDIMVTEKGKIVVLNVDCNSKEISNFVKNKLNYKKINSTVLKTTNQIYKMPLTVKKQ